MNPSRWLIHFATLERLNASEPDGYAGLTYSAPLTIQCRYESDRRRITDVNGAEVVSDARVFTMDVLQPGDLITPPGESVARLVLAVDKTVDVGGHPVLYEVLL